MQEKEFQTGVVTGTLHQEKEKPSTRRVQKMAATLAVQKTLEQRPAISCLIINHQPPLIQRVGRNASIPSALVAAVLKVER